ncbi:right-handed parallel beta-helix repeat-containing protein [Candidatus Bipolaricaulota bacterium]|nr:right-handed parallel beta-helix repeat-containing protein [Candidatus Bipolaricaulota bacterium]
MRKGALLSCTAALLCLIGIVVAASGGDLQDRNPIVITSDYEFTAKNGVVAGSGTVDDPYIIEGWQIDAGYHDYGIRIDRTSRYFVIRNVEISGAAKAAIFLSYVRNALVQDCKLTGNWIGITLNFASYNRVSGCTLASNAEGLHLRFSRDNQVLSNAIYGNDYAAIWLYASNTNEIVGNFLAESHMGVYLDLGSEGNLLYKNTFLDNVHNAHSDDLNQWDYEGEGNYWFNYVGIDADENGIGDSPYVIASDSDQDNFPLLRAP